MAAVRRRTTPQNPLVLDDFICSICRDIFKFPRKLPCSHIFCKECLQQCKNSGSNGNQCPYCRKNYSIHQETNAYEVDDNIRRGSSKCSHCNEVFPLRRMQDHLNTCSSKQFDARLSSALNKAVSSFSIENTEGTESLPVATGFGVVQNQRCNIRQFPVTYDCPYCNVKKLGRESLLQHVRMLHKQANPNVVCPICAAMPWGNPTQKSQNFIQHIELRHRFDYDYFVEMNKDEDEMYKETLARSMYDQGRFY